MIIASHHPNTISPATPLNTTLHLQYHKRSTLPPPLNNTLHLEHRNRSDPPRPFERYVTSWASEGISPAPPCTIGCTLGKSAPPPRLNTMLHQSHKTLTLPPLRNNTLHHKIASPPFPLNNTLHLEHRKTLIAPFIWTPYCILSSTRHQIRLPPLNNTLHLGHYKTSSPPPLALAPPLNTMLHLQHDKTSTPPPPLNNTLHLETPAPPPPLNTMLHLQRSTPRPPLNTTPPLEDCKTSAPPPSLNTMLHLEHHKRSTPAPLEWMNEGKKKNGAVREWRNERM